ncbi:MAG: PTS glucitol/sorbitol transporter subunit IIA [Lactobacillales bacterium]|jgi:PTS system glucitol/sorbitol-specific IIA component|nr:PTS glucitol/sorbitol transporter subunit IIA [Lactobacillales bacterium]
MYSTVTEIGKYAINSEEPLLVLFGESATDLIRESAIIQKASEGSFVDLEEGDILSFGEQPYEITQIGRLANKQLREIGHTVLIFEAPTEEKDYANGIHLYPYELPQVEVGMEIHFEKSDNYGD